MSEEPLPKVIEFTESDEPGARTILARTETTDGVSRLVGYAYADEINWQSYAESV